MLHACISAVAIHDEIDEEPGCWGSGNGEILCWLTQFVHQTRSQAKGSGENIPHKYQEASRCVVHLFFVGCLYSCPGRETGQSYDDAWRDSCECAVDAKPKENGNGKRIGVGSPGKKGDRGSCEHMGDAWSFWH